MNSSFKTGLSCKHCTKEGIPASQHHILKTDGNLMCGRCGWSGGTDTDLDIPEQVGRVLAALIGDAIFSIVDRGNSPSTSGEIRMNSRVLSRFTCKLRWSYLDHGKLHERSSKFYERSNIYEPSQAKMTPPVLVDHALHVLSKLQFRLTEMASGRPVNNSYARLEFIFGKDDTAPSMVFGSIEDLPPVLLVRIELTWAPQEVKAE